MGTYRKKWACCGSVTETEAWEPECCPFCTDDAAPFRKDAERYRKLRDGQNWPAAFARHDAPEPLRGVDLDAAIDGTEPHIDGYPLFSGLPQP